MPSYAAFLRGMNVGGHRITNVELTAAVEAVGLHEVATFRASGNVVFSSPRHSTERLARDIEAGLQKTLGYAVPTFLRSGEELRAIAARRPFSAEEERVLKGKAQVAFLSAAPAARERQAVLAMAGKRDALALEGRELHWLPIGPMSESELDLKAIERLLGAFTVRTTGTVAEIAARYFGAG
jgi:uncharacterized protein (DUF1697 family)